MHHEAGLRPPVKYFTDHSKAVLLLWIICVIYILCLPCFHVYTLLPYGRGLTSWYCWEKADLLALVCGVKLCFCFFPMWYPGSGALLDCIDS